MARKTSKPRASRSKQLQTAPRPLPSRQSERLQLKRTSADTKDCLGAAVTAARPVQVSLTVQNPKRSSVDAKHRLGAATAAAAAPRPVRVSLTQENLKLFNTMTRPRKKPRLEPCRALATTMEYTGYTEITTTPPKNVSSTASIFDIRAVKNGVLDTLDSKPPANLDTILGQLNKSRDTPSPTGSQYRAYAYAVRTAPNEATIVHETAKLLKEYDDWGYRKVFNQALTGFPKNVGFNDGMSAPQPDMLEGLHMTEFRPFYADDALGGAAAIFRDDKYSLALPHVAGEWKGPGKSMLHASDQAAYDGAALVYGRTQALALLGTADPARHANVCTFTTDGTTLNFNTHYAAPCSDGPLPGGQTTEYHRYPLASTTLLPSFDDFKRARRQLRNMQDGARDASYALRDQLRAHRSPSSDGGQLGADAESDDEYEAKQGQDGGTQQPSDRSTKRCRSRRHTP